MTDFAALLRTLTDSGVEFILIGVCLDLETLIRVKRAAGRPKDLDALAELEALREELRKPPS